MNHGVISFSSLLAAAFFALPLAARADTNPDFDDDAKPILRMQPGLLQYVESRFDVKDTGTAKYPGDDDRRAMPPYIFRARPLGSDGPYNLRLLIQPGQPGHILGVVDITKVHLGAPANHSPQEPPPPQQPEQAPPPYGQPPNPYSPPPGQYGQPPAQYSPPPQQSVQVPELSAPPQEQQQAPQQPAPAPQNPAPAPQPSEPTADTPSGPIMDSNSQAPSSSQDSNSSQPPLAPPPDPAPPAQ